MVTSLLLAGQVSLCRTENRLLPFCIQNTGSFRSFSREPDPFLAPEPPRPIQQCVRRPSCSSDSFPSEEKQEVFE